MYVGQADKKTGI